LPLVHISFYGVPASGQPDATGGGPPGSTNENQIVGATGLTVQFSNTTTGTQVACNWDFGDGSTQSNCASTVSKIYTTRGVYNVTLSVNASTLTRPSYVLVGCKVPVLAGNKLHFNEAGPIWTAAGFTGPISAAPGSTGNFPINFQAPVGGQVNPTGGCAAGITLGK
jgi:PKD repeat protein